MRPSTVTQNASAASSSSRSTALNSAEATNRFGLVKSGSNSQRAVDQLDREGHIVPSADTATGWRLVDPLLEVWVRNGRSWPDLTSGH